MNLGLREIKIFARRSVTDNLGLKLVALIITLGLVTIVRFQEKVERWVDVEVNVVRPSETSGLLLTSEPPDTVRVSLRGRPSIIESIKTGPMKQVVMNLGNRTKPGSFTFYFVPEMCDFSSGVEVVGINPDVVLTRIERIVTRRLPVRVKTHGRLKSGAQLEEEPSVDPPEVTVAGPASLVRSLINLETEAVDIEGFGVGEHHAKIPIRRTEGLTFKYIDDLEITLKVKWTPGQRMIAGLLVRAKGNPESAVDIRPAEVAVSLVGAKVALDRLDPGLLVVQVDLDKAEPRKGGVFRAKVEVSGLPKDVKVGSIVPETVLVKTRVPAAPKTK